MLPQYPARWNRALLGRDAVCWHANASTMLDAGGARILGSDLNRSISISTRLGRGVRWVDSSNGGLSFGAIDPTLKATTGLSFLIIGNPPNAADFKAYFSQRAADGSPRTDLWCNQDAAGANEAGTILLRVVNTGGSNVSMRVLAQTDGALHVWTGYHNSTNTGKCWRDGVPQTVTNNAALSGTLWEAGQETRIGNVGASASTGSVLDTSVMLMCIMWPRQVDDVLLRRLGMFPELALMSSVGQRRSLSLLPVLSAATVTSITGTAATPRVTITFP
jgi:hypothetical protein